MGFTVVGVCIFDDAVDSFADVVVDSFVDAVDGPVIFFDDEVDSRLDVDVFGRGILVVVDSCFAFDVAVDSFVDFVDVCFM